MKQSDIAAIIERDLLRDETRPAANIVACRSCGFTFCYRGRQGDLNGNFCSRRCQDWYDAGNPSYEQQQEWCRKPSALTICCVGCGKQFESKGLRCCSIDCERGYREHQDNLAVMAEVGMEPKAKRICERDGCTARIPQWRNGRRVSSKARFCSPKCQQKTRNSQNRILNAERIKKSA
jgi:hypothetical protein